MKIPVFVLTMTTCAVNAGEVVLTNGDHFSGELVKIEGRDLYWDTGYAGEMVIPLTKLADMSTAAEIRANDLAGPCNVTDAMGDRLDYECQNGASGTLILSEFDYVDLYTEVEPKTAQFRGKLFGVGQQATGNTEERSWAVKEEASYRTEAHRHQTKLDFDTVEKGEEEAEVRLTARYTYDWFASERWYWHNSVEGGFDEAAGIDARYRIGTGIGFQVWDRDTRALALESSLTYVSEEFRLPPDPGPDFVARDTFAAWQWGLDYRQKLAEKTEFFHKQQLTLSLENTDDWNLETETGITAPVVGNLYGEVRLDYDLDNTPATTARRENTKFSVGVGYSW